MKSLSEKVAGIAPSATIEISNRAKKMQREGIDVISLSIGEPDFDTPKHIKDACIDALNRGETHYAPSDGIPELLTAISEKIEKENKFPCKPDQAIVTVGAKDAIYEGMEAVLNPGDEVLLLTPAWVSYEPCVQMAGGRLSSTRSTRRPSSRGLCSRAGQRQHQDDRGQLTLEPLGCRL